MIFIVGMNILKWFTYAPDDFIKFASTVNKLYSLPELNYCHLDVTYIMVFRW